MNRQHECDTRKNQALAAMDQLFEGFFEWLEGQYDPKSGGFFYARSSKESGAFIPDIESTAQAVNIMERAGILERLPEEIKNGLIRFFQGKQDPSGYFYDEDPNMRLDEVMVGRAIGYSSHSLHKLGAAPLYPLPSVQNAPAYMESPETYLQWLENVELCNSWRGCDRLCNSAPYIRALPEEDRKPYLATAFAFLDRIQDKETGLWGQGAPYVRISGTFKLLTFYRTFAMPVPRQELIYQSILHCLRTEFAKDMCYIRNPIDLLSEMENFHILEEDFAEILEITLANIKKLKRPDGGFSREHHRSPPAPNVAQVKEDEWYPDMPKAVPIGLGKVEGDMNAGTQALLIRTLLRRLADSPVPLHAPAHVFSGK
ncbi:hypothetical protein [Gorillibacterium sp. sgz5001074]|uniref:hypothetical protein n=1 Tax=Gorillibacterium sp. sgz5001074 TaxID=3446695 RepID=UPI003F67480D